MSSMRSARPWRTQYVVISLILGVFLTVSEALAIEPRPASTMAQWSGELWGELQVVPAITKAGNSITARAIVRGGPAGNPSWHCSQYSTWVAAGTSDINIVIPDEWSFASGPGFVRAIGGRVMVQQSSAGDPPPYGWEDRVSDTCYCYVDTWGASGGCATREVTPTFATAHQEEILAPGATNKWVAIAGEFGGWNGVAWFDSAVAYVYVIDEETELTDVDEDGIADEWEIAHFGDLTTADETSSYDDGDDVDDFTEYHRWKEDTRDGDGVQYDPTAKNTARDNSNDDGGGEGGGEGGMGCGSGAPFALLAGPVGLVGLGRTGGRRGRSRRAGMAIPRG